MEDSTVFGVVSGTVAAPRVAYFPVRLIVGHDPEQSAGAVRLTEVFRFAAPCAGTGCRHFDGVNCRLASRVVKLLPAVVDALPACPLRPDCRWWQQEGKSACKRCPQVVTETWYPSDELRATADPMG